MKTLTKMMRSLLIVAFISCGGCAGGGSGQSSTPAPSPKVIGVAAAGLPLAGTVTLKDSSAIAKQLSTAIAAGGSFSIDVPGLTPPFLLQGSGTAGGTSYTFYSLASAAGTCNINPLTHLAVAMANGGQEPSALFADPTPAKMQALSAAMSAYLTSLQSQMTPLLNIVGVTPGNIVTDQYAYGGGLDTLFDMVSITVNSGSVEIVSKYDGLDILPPTPIHGGIFQGNMDRRGRKNI